jgi:hypothetical protein
LPIDLEAPSLIEIAGVSEERFVTKIGMGRAGDEFVTIEIVAGYCEGLRIDMAVRRPVQKPNGEQVRFF